MKTCIRRSIGFFILALTSLSAVGCVDSGSGGPRFEISFPESVAAEPLDGRVLLLFSTSTEGEPRFTTASRRNPRPLFGIDAEGIQPGQRVVIDDAALGFPIESLRNLPPGRYNVQAVLHIYTTFHRADGHTVKLPMDHWEGQRWNLSPGNLYSEPMWLDLDLEQAGSVEIELTKRIPEIEPPVDDEFVRHVKIRSEMLSDFWGTDMYLGAAILVPPGFDQRSEARYPVAYQQGHFRSTWDLRRQPPDPEVPAPQRARQQAGYRFYQAWTSGQLPKMLVVKLQDPNPYYDDSYAVNSANLGPYGDAITQELIPYIEKEFRAIGVPWARTTFGGSTGGWRALAAQVFYPDFFNGAWVFCPDPVDFRYFQLVNIYEDENAYYSGNGFKKNPIRPWMRGVDDQVFMTEREASILELVKGTRGRSGDQMDIFQAVYGPVGPDGYPRLLYDKNSGAIDKEVAEYWRENYDLRYILERDWAELGPKLQGKLRIYMGDTDTYYLEEAARLLQAFLLNAKDPAWQGEFHWGERAPHCWTGAPAGTDSTHYYLPKMAEHMRRTAPRGADLQSWNY